MKLQIALALACVFSARGADDFVLVPASDTQVTDSVTGLSLRIHVSPFRIDPFEVSQREFAAIMGHNPSHYRGEDRPVENVTWWDAIRFANRRSVNEGLRPAYDLSTGQFDPTANGYRLPTDAEWTAAFGAGKPSGNLRPPGTKDVALDQPLAAGTLPLGSFPPNEYGIHDMAGNVWEWCNDRHSAVPVIDAVRDPAGPAVGPDRVLRGGSFVSTSGQWNKGLRTSMPPDSRSRYTGFRLVRPEPRTSPTPALLTKVITAGTDTGNLQPPRNPDDVRREWLTIIGTPEAAKPKPATRLIESFEDPIYTGQLLELQTEPDSWERVLVMRPRSAAPAPRPVLVVPFYDVDTPAGRNLGGRRFTPPGVRAFAYRAVQQGYIAIVVRWFGESYGESYDEAVANLALRHSGCTGLGKWVWDSQRLLDWIETLPDADPKRIGMFGHSLGGKMTFYAAAFDPRVAVAVASEPGIGLSMTNYEDFWYLGTAIRKLPPGADHHELLTLIAPRPFLLIAGGDSDKDASLTYLNAARPAWARSGAADRLGFFNHSTGHSPSPESLEIAMEWLDATMSSSK